MKLHRIYRGWLLVAGRRGARLYVMRSARGSLTVRLNPPLPPICPACGYRGSRPQSFQAAALSWASGCDRHPVAL